MRLINVLQVLLLFAMAFGMTTLYYCTTFGLPNFTLIEGIKMTINIPLIQPISSEVSPDETKKCPIGAKAIFDDYCVYEFWIRRKMYFDDPLITLCTQGTPEFLHYVADICERWQGPISVAAYVFNEESFSETTSIIQNLTQCDACIRESVDWHLIHRNTIQPTSVSNMPVTATPCTSIPTKRSDASKRRNVTYPINVGRNIARIHANTPLVFSSDIELLPSQNILQRFEVMIKENNITSDDLQFSKKKQVWVVPVFEVYSGFKAPWTKAELKTMFDKRQAISFHKYRCGVCHTIPKLNDWINYTSPFGEDGPLSIWMTVKRTKEFELSYWEPFFIANNDFPLFDVRLTWEGKSNKMQVSYEMCLMNYDFHILNDAFLVHVPGVNVYSSKKDAFRFKYMREQSKITKNITTTLHQIYGRKKECEGFY